MVWQKCFCQSYLLTVKLQMATQMPLKEQSSSHLIGISTDGAASTSEADNGIMNKIRHESCTWCLLCCTEIKFEHVMFSKKTENIQMILTQVFTKLYNFYQYYPKRRWQLKQVDVSLQRSTEVSILTQC